MERNLAKFRVDLGGAGSVDPQVAVVESTTLLTKYLNLD